MTEIFQGSDLNEIVNEMLAHMQTQIESSVLTNSRFVFDEVLYLEVSFYQLSLTRRSSYIPLPSWIESKNVLINLKNENDEKCFRWSAIAALRYKEIGKNPQCISNIMRYDNYNWSGLEFPVTINKINEFEKHNNVLVNFLGVKGQQIYICRKPKLNYQPRGC